MMVSHNYQPGSYSHHGNKSLVMSVRNFLDEICWDGKTYFKCCWGHSRHFVPDKMKSRNWADTDHSDATWTSASCSCTMSSPPRWNALWTCEPPSAVSPQLTFVRYFVTSTRKVTDERRNSEPRLSRWQVLVGSAWDVMSKIASAPSQHLYPEVRVIRKGWKECKGQKWDSVTK